VVLAVTKDQPVHKHLVEMAVVAMVQIHMQVAVIILLQEQHSLDLAEVELIKAVRMVALEL
jgi:hypothetical protein